jgi:hypothetical protein
MTVKSCRAMWGRAPERSYTSKALPEKLPPTLISLFDEFLIFIFENKHKVLHRCEEPPGIRGVFACMTLSYHNRF